MFGTGTTRTDIVRLPSGARVAVTGQRFGKIRRPAKFAGGEIEEVGWIRLGKVWYPAEVHPDDLPEPKPANFRHASRCRSVQGGA